MRSIHSVFRQHPDLEATGKLSILGESQCTAKVMDTYMRRRNPKAPEVAELYLRQGQRFGVRGDAAFCQMIYETRSWTAQVAGPYWAPLTLDQWANEASIEVLMRLLFAFASETPMRQESDRSSIKQTEMIDRAGWRGMAPCWEDLNSKWTRSGHQYGQDIVAIWRNMMEWKGSGEVIPWTGDLAVDNSVEGERVRSSVVRVNRKAASLDWSSTYTEEMKGLKELGLLPNPEPHPERKVSWAELASLLKRWEERSTPVTIEGNGKEG